MFSITVCMPTSAPGEILAARTVPKRTAFGGGWIEHTVGGPAIFGTDGDVSVFAHGRILHDGQALKPGNAAVEQLAEAWLRDGAGIMSRLSGEFLVAFSETQTGRWLAAADRFSCFRLYYGGDENGVAFGTTPIAIARALGRTPELDPQAVLAYAYFHVIPAPLSVCTGIRRLDLGEYLIGNEFDSWKVRRYWQPRFEETRAFDFEAERARFMGALRSGVAECADGLTADGVGCFLSGGTDSSTIAGLLTEHFGTGVRTFSIGFGVHGYDETRYSRIAARHFATRHSEYYLTPADVEQGLPIIASQYEQPFGNSSAVPTFFCARLGLEAGVRRMLGGDGGDELYGGNERYAKQWIFSVWNEVPHPIRKTIIEPLLFGPLETVDIALLGKARSYIEQTRIPLPDRLYGKHNLLERFGRRKVFTDALLSQAASFEPAELARDVWARCDAATQINRLLAYDFKFTLADSDLPKVTGMCEAAGVEASFPMLTHGVVDHSLALAPGQKLHRTQLRYFFKRALRGFLPDEVLRKRKHGFGMPFGAWVLTHPGLMALVEDALAGLANRGYLQPAFIAELRTMMASGHAGYYGTMVWILAVLELWLREHFADARCS